MYPDVVNAKGCQGNDNTLTCTEYLTYIEHGAAVKSE